MKLKLSCDIEPREVEFYGKVICTESKEHDSSWEFQENKEYNLYKQIFEDGQVLYIVYNETSGWYANYKDINNLNDKDFSFRLEMFKIQNSSLYGEFAPPFKMSGDCITQSVELINQFGIEITEKEVRRRYSEPKRHFHTTEHLTDVLSHIFDYYNCSDDLVPMVMAGIFHDIVYDPQRKDNEEKSVELLEFWTSDLNKSTYSDIIGQAKKIIMATKNHDKIHDLISDFNKFDCSILDKELPDLLKWEEQIRKEYSFAPWDVYKERRLKFLNLSLPNHKENRENLLSLIKKIEQTENDE